MNRLEAIAYIREKSTLVEQYDYNKRTGGAFELRRKDEGGTLFFLQTDNHNNFSTFLPCKGIGIADEINYFDQAY